MGRRPQGWVTMPDLATARRALAHSRSAGVTRAGDRPAGRISTVLAANR